MATYVNDLRLKEIATGDESGTWGTSTNTNLELIAEAFSYGTEASFGSDADATTTIADGATDPARSLYFKVTSGVSLTATRTLTLAPNDVSKVWIIENATSGSQSINISQGSGSNVTIGNGDVKIVYSDGGGASANVVDAFTDLSVTDKLKIEGSTPTLTIGDGGEEDTKLVFDGNAKDFYVGLDDSADKLVIGEGSTVGTNNILTITDDSVTIGDGAEVDTKIVFDGNAQDFYIGLDDSADDLIIGVGSTVGTTPAIIVNESQQVGIGVAPTHNFNLQGTGTVEARFRSTDGDCSLQISSDTDEGQDSILEFTSGTSGRGRIVYDHNTTAASQKMNFVVGDVLVDAMTIDGAGNVGIGTTSPDDLLHVFAGDSTASASTLSAVNIEKNDDVALTFMTPNSKKAQIRFADPQDTGNGIIAYDHNTNDMSFSANGPEKLRILNSGGITFNGDTAAANALDDYEEGTWTPTYSSNGGLSTVTGFTSSSGFYIKIGNLVHLYGTFTMNGTSGTRIGNGDFVRLTGLPYSDGYSTLTTPGNVYTSRAFTNLGGFSGICYYYADSYMVVQFLGQASTTWSGDENALVKLELTFTDNLPY